MLNILKSTFCFACVKKNIECIFKGIIHPKWNIPSLFTHPHVVSKSVWGGLDPIDFQ